MNFLMRMCLELLLSIIMNRSHTLEVIESFATQRLSGFSYRKGAMTLRDAKILDQIVPGSHP